METSSGTDSCIPNLRATNSSLRSEQTEYAKYREHFRRQSRELLEANEKLLSCLKGRYSTYAQLVRQDTELDSMLIAKRKENQELSAQIALLSTLVKSKNRKKRMQKIVRKAKKELRVARDNLERDAYEKEMKELEEQTQKAEDENKEMEKEVEKRMSKFAKDVEDGKIEKEIQEKLSEFLVKMNECAKLKAELMEVKMKANELDVSHGELLRALFGDNWQAQANIQSEDLQDLAKESSEKPRERKRHDDEFQYEYEYDYEYDGDGDEKQKQKVKRKKKVLKEQESEKKEEERGASRRSRRKNKGEEKQEDWKGRKSRKHDVRRKKERQELGDDKVPYSLLDEPLVTHSADPFEKPEDTDTYRNVMVADLDMQTQVRYLEEYASMLEEQRTLLDLLTTLQKELCDRSNEIRDVDEEITQLREQIAQFSQSRRATNKKWSFTGSVCRIDVEKTEQRKQEIGVNCTPIMTIEEIKKRIAELSQTTARQFMLEQQESDLQHALSELSSQWKTIRHSIKVKDEEKQTLLDRLMIIDPEFYTRANTVREAIINVNPKLNHRLQDRREKLLLIEERLQELDDEYKDINSQISDVKYINDCLKKQVFTMSQKPRGNIRQMCGVLRGRRSVINSNSKQVAIHQIECNNLDKMLNRYMERSSKETRKGLEKRNNKIHAKIDELKRGFPGLRSLREQRHIVVTNDEEMIVLQSRIAQLNTEMDAWKIQMSAANSKIDKLVRHVQQLDIPVPERYP